MKDKEAIIKKIKDALEKATQILEDLDKLGDVDEEEIELAKLDEYADQLITLIGSYDIDKLKQLGDLERSRNISTLRANIAHVDAQLASYLDR